MIAAIFAAAAAAVTVLILLLRYKRLKCRKCCRTLLIIPVTADDDLFERRVKACYWEESFGNPLYAKEILLVIMQPSANAYTARRLAQEYRSVHAVYLSSLNDYLIRNYVNYECKKTDS